MPQCWEKNKVRYEEGENEKLIEPLKRGEKKVVNYARICEEIVDKNEKKIDNCFMSLSEIQDCASNYRKSVSMGRTKNKGI